MEGGKEREKGREREGDVERNRERGRRQGDGGRKREGERERERGQHAEAKRWRGGKGKCTEKMRVEGYLGNNGVCKGKFGRYFELLGGGGVERRDALREAWEVALATHNIYNMAK